MKYVLLALFLALLYSCNNESAKEYRYYEGPIQGTTFHITYEWNKDLAPQIDSLLETFNKSLSNYDPKSNISLLNTNQTDELDELTQTMIEASLYVYKKTDGAFDITVAPIVNAWGFGWIKGQSSELPDSARIDSLLIYVGMDKVHVENSNLIKQNPNTSIITNAVAQGLSVDYVADYFFKLGLKNFLVEIGGEIYCFGENNRGEPWRIGIDKPIEGSDESNRENQIIINLSGKAIATSGNYRKFVENGKDKYGHSIDPRTGYPANNCLLSVSVISDNCMQSDAFATGFMVCGLDKSLEIAEEIPELEAYFIYIDENEQVKAISTSGFDDCISE
ncbi:MAG: thiamine biosynthesis protein ApbE [Marinilabiliales bacterium]|nr:MAG: thiamine biosynthesis protein ApbE [Marinilabiliales bacterium]